MALSNRVQPYAAADRRMMADLEHYSAKLVKIQDKAGQVVPFRWREAQRQLHARLERQLEARGLVRAIVLKARRMGVSTYVGVRYYHRATMRFGRNAFILTHEDKSTQALFDMIRRVHATLPADYQPATTAASANELRFAHLDSGYRVGTARNVHGVGRGMTLQLMHGSEVAFWPQAEVHFAGILKTVSLVGGTEIILESTANGIGGEFYRQWALAERGQSDFIPIFLPWTIEPDHTRPLPSDYEPSLEEQDYQRLHGLSDEQLCWAHFENINLGGEPGRICPTFRQENPATAAEAFQSTSHDSYVPAEAVLRARRVEIDPVAYEGLPRVLGVDVARGGGDQTRIVDRQGRKAGRIDRTIDSDDLVHIAGAVMTLLRDNPDLRRAYIDITGVGAGVYDVCRANGFGQRVSGVNFGSSAQDPLRYRNRRAEMWGRMKEWLLDEGGADIPDDDQWHGHIVSAGYKYDHNSRLQLEEKDKIKERIGGSPDIGDALGLTFAEILPVDEPDQTPKWMLEHLAGESGGNWITA